MHTISGRWKLGLSLATVTAAFWGLLPIAAVIIIRTVDTFTLVWFRFLTAALMLGGVLAVTGELPRLRDVGRSGWVILAVALTGLAGNFVLYVVALHYASPTINQVVTQLSPILLMLGGIAVFHERFSPIRWVGFGLLLVGLPLFFNVRLPELMHLRSGLGLGVLMLVICSVIWAVYGLAQKWMLRRIKSQQILLIVYSGAAIILFPLAHPAVILKIDGFQAVMLAFACVNTVFAYGAFAEALKHWEASRVGATLTLTPLFTMVAMWMLEHFAPGLVQAEKLNLLSVLGALVVIGGSMLCALGASGAVPMATGVDRTRSPQSSGG